MAIQESLNKKLRTAKEVRSFLNITPNTLQKLRKEGGIPYIKIGGAFRYDLDVIMGPMKKGGVTC